MHPVLVALLDAAQLVLYYGRGTITLNVHAFVVDRHPRYLPHRLKARRDGILDSPGTAGKDIRSAGQRTLCGSFRLDHRPWWRDGHNDQAGKRPRGGVTPSTPAAGRKRDK
jgi:hypothetical protein